MADLELKQKIREALRRSALDGPDEAVDVSDGEIDPHIHVVVFSRKFDDLDLIKTQDLIWPHIERNLTPDEWGQVTLVVGVSPQHAKAFI